MRLSVPVAAAVFATGLPVAVLLDSSAARAAAVFVETNPSTVRAGDEIGLRASCDDNLKEATVTAPPFGTVTVAPEFGFLTATARVPANIRAGSYRVDLRCPDGRTASSTMHVVTRVEPTRGPATGGGGTAPGRTASVLLGGGAAAVLAGLALAVVSARRRRIG